MSNKSPLQVKQVNIFLRLVPRFRTAGVLPLMESLLQEGFVDIFFELDRLSPSRQKALLQELKASDKELSKHKFSLGEEIPKKKIGKDTKDALGGLLAYLRFVRALIQNSLSPALTPSKSGKKDFLVDKPLKSLKPLKPLVRSWFTPPSYDLRPLEEKKHQLVHIDATNMPVDLPVDLSTGRSQVNPNLSTNHNPKPKRHSFSKKAQALMKSFAAFEKLGTLAIKDIALVLVAGGLGERMQSKAAKVDRKVHYLAHPKIENHSFFEYYLETILALQAHYYAKTGKRTHIPLLVMGAEHNYKSIIGVVNKYTGKGKLASGQVEVRKQLLAPCLTGAGEIVIHDGKLMKKPLGHGFVHTLIHEEGYLEQLKIQKKPYLFFLQDTNPQVINTILSSLGMLKSHGSGFLWIGVERQQGEAAGVIVGARTKTSPQPVRQIINIEYNEIPPDLNRRANKKNDLVANTNNFWITTTAYKTALRKTGGVLPYMVNPKKDRDGKIKPVRPESLMQDLAKHLFLAPVQSKTPRSYLGSGGIKAVKAVKALSENITTVTYPRYRSFSPVKKPLALSLTSKPQSANIDKTIISTNHMPKSWEYTALELEINHNLTTLTTMAVNNNLLWTQGGNNGKKSSLKLSISEGICAYLSAFPKVVLPPRYLLSTEYLNTRIKNCTLYPGSFLYVEDDGVTLDGVTVHAGAALIILGKKAGGFEVRDLVVEETGFSYEPLKRNKEYSEEERNRGHCIVWKNPMVINATRPKKPRNYRTH